MTFIFWLQFVAVCFFGAISPGPSLALIIRNSLKFNRTAGILSAIGHGVGIGIYATLAILGLHLILSSNIYVFKSIQFVGSFFLLLMGILFILDKKTELDLKDKQHSINSFFQGIAIAIFNPKILIWFAAVYSQFILLESSIITNSIFVITAALIDCLWYIVVAIVVTGYGLKDFFQKRKLTIQKISGSVLILISFLLIYKLFNN
tara:strand:- start:3148 stop:3762 length:615 start_codon:yes stop_codon:yes gene_type:complete